MSRVLSAFVWCSECRDSRYVSAKHLSSPWGKGDRYFRNTEQTHLTKFEGWGGGEFLGDEPQSRAQKDEQELDLGQRLTVRQAFWRLVRKSY